MRSASTRDSRSRARRERTWLRGVQITDSNGIVFFDTVFPGWYTGRTTHFHLKVRINNQTSVTTQFYFPEWLPDLVYTNFAPYTARGKRNTTNAQDRIYNAVNDLIVIPPYAGLIIGVV